MLGLLTLLACDPSPQSVGREGVGASAKDVEDSYDTLQPSASATGDYFGLGLATGDFNGDGHTDLAVGAPDSGSTTGSGTLYLYAGSASGLDTSSGSSFTVSGSTWLAATLSSPGDVNGDGVDDLAVNEGKTAISEAVYVYLGASTGTFSSSQKVVASDWAASDGFGGSISLSGDLNGDGYDDMAVGADGKDGAYSNQGAVYVYYGAATGIDTGSEVQIPAPYPADDYEFGWRVALGPDSDGDGKEELIASSLGTLASTIFVFNGSTTVASTELWGTSSNWGLGRSLSLGNDVNGDGFDDLIAADPSYRYTHGSTGGYGVVHVFYGSTTGFSDADVGTAGFCSYRCYYAWDTEGVGDVDGDGYDDVLAVRTSKSIGSSTPDVYLHYGSVTGLEQDGTLLGNSDFTNLTMASADFDGDGFSDPVLGWTGSDASWTSQAGEVHLFAGQYRTWYADSDGDGFGDASTSVDAATAPSGYVRDDTDCDDSDATVNPDATEVVADGKDNDCDGYEKCKEDRDEDGYAELRGEVQSSDMDCTDPGEGDSSMPRTDCDDGDPGINPGETEGPGDGIDQDCDGTELCWDDQDGDGYGAAGGATVSSTDEDCQDSGEASETGDCDDADTSVNPGATEVVGDGVDQDCDGSELCYTDADGDGHSAELSSADMDCDDSGESTTASGSEDCDDSDATVYPGATETVGDGIDQDCDDADACYVDGDEDGWGSSSLVDSTSASCSDVGEALVDGDCDDADKSVNPGVTEGAADGVDQDCDGTELCYLDDDGDGYAGGDTVYDSDLGCGSAGSASVADEDCDDSDASVNPGASEVAGDGVDQDCDGSEDCYEDADGDGHATSTLIQVEDLSCGSHSTSAGSDCDDSDSSAWPGATETVADGIDQDCDGGDTCYGDADGDGYVSGTVASADLDCTDSGEAAASSTTDCDDGDASVYPGATEGVGDGVDSDCDGLETCYVDGDADGYRTSDTVSDSAVACSSAGSAPASTPDGDCDDADASVNPGATELLADGVDSDCDGTELCWKDEDGDGFHAGEQLLSPSLDCSADGVAGTEAGADDCDDATASTWPGATETPGDGVDSDCDGAELCYVDADEDGYHNDTTTSTGTLDCSEAGQADGSVPGGDCDDGSVDFHPDAEESDCTDPNDYNCDGSVQYADADADGWPACTECDDADPAKNPGQDELCDGFDNDCDGIIDNDDALDAGVWYEDGDRDGFGLETSPLQACTMPGGYSELSGDCEDRDPAIHPDAAEVCGDGIDNDCDGAGGPDDDEDGDTLSYTEELDLGTDPCDPDSDGDGDLDGADPRPLGCEGCASQGGEPAGGLAGGALLLSLLLLRRRREEAV